jgi:hypothetical protein
MNTRIVSSLHAAIDHHVGSQPIGRLESHDLASLSKRILAPVAVVKKLLAGGILRSQNPVHSGDATGRQMFFSDDLNSIKRSVLSAIVEKTVEQCDGVPTQVTLAAGEALHRHVASFQKKSRTTELSRFPAGLVQLARYPETDDEPSLVDRTANATGKIAIGAGLGYGAAALLRGRRLKPGGGFVEQLLAGGRANLVSARAAASGLSVGASKVLDVLAGRPVR